MRRWVFLALLVAACLGSGCARVVREADLFHPRADQPGTVRSGELVQVPRPDAVLGGRLFVTDPSRPLLLYCPGNGETVGDNLPKLTWLARTFTLNVACIDYRGYGASSGVPTMTAVAEDYLAIHDWLRARFPDVPLIVYGRSLGTGMGAWVAANRPVDALVLEAPPTTAPEVIAVWSRTLLPWYVRWCMHLEPDATVRDFDRYPLQVVPRVSCPLLVLHGDRDATIPAELGRRVYEAAGSRDKRWLLVTAAGHNDLRIDRQPVLGALTELITGVSGR